MSLTELTVARAELQQLQQVRATLSESLSNHAAQLKSIGALPPEELLEQLVEYRTRLARLSSNLAATNERPPLTGPTFERALSLESVLLAINLRDAASVLGATLEQVQRLAHVDDPAFAPLAQCRADATAILQTIKQGSQGKLDLAALKAALPPFEAICALVETDTDLTDEAWAACQEKVAARWGKLLCTALARGKIRPPAKAQPTDSASRETVEIASVSATASSVPEGCHEVSTPQADAPSIPETPSAEASDSVFGSEFHDETLVEVYADDIDTVFDTQHDMIFDAVGKPGAERSPSRSYRSNELKQLTAESYHWLQQQASMTIPAATSFAAASTAAPVANAAIAELARRALQSESSQRSLHVSQLIYQLILNEQYAQAFHLARSIEGRSADPSSAPPTWLLHAVTLCRYLCYSNGEMGRLLESDLEQFEPALLTAGGPDVSAANGFLARAAALLPALLTTSTAAAKIITTFRISPGLSHLYNYCGRILTYGQQLQGQAADLFTPDCDASRWAAEVAHLQQEIEQWLPATANRYCAATKSTQFFMQPHWTLVASTAVRHELATRLWSKWQEVLRIVQRLLKPVRAGDLAERNWVKSEVERLTHAVQLESSAAQLDEQRQVEILLFPDATMIGVIREAVDFANRWLRLCAAKPDQGRTLMTREAETLRDEILERTDGVLAELSAYNQAHDSQCIQASIACLCRTIEHLRLIFSPHSTLPLREASPVAVLKSELVDIPHLEFDALGMPTLQAAELEAVLLTKLSGGSAEQLDNLEHRLTARILESNLRQREQQQEAWKPCREAEVSESCWD